MPLQGAGTGFRRFWLAALSLAAAVAGTVAFPHVGAAAGLPRPKDPEAAEQVSVLERAQKDEDRIPPIRWLASQGGAAAVPALRAVAKGASSEIQIEVLSALEDIKGDEAVAAAGEILARAQGRKIKLRALEALDFLAGPKAAKAMARVLSDADARVQTQAADRLGHLGEKVVVLDLWKAYRRERDPDVKAMLLEALWRLDEDVEAEQKKLEADD